MWPWGHAAVGYLVYALYQRYWVGWRPAGLAVVALGFGTQFPDLVDKPLAWNLGLLPNGRTLMHSLVLTAVVVVLLWRIAIRTNRQSLATAFGIGYVSHLVGDALYPVLAGNFTRLGFLAWPLVPAIEADGGGGIIAYILAAEVTPQFVFEVVLALIALASWYRHGCPGLGVLVPGRTGDTEPEQRLDS